jgi:hypothetical protein
MQTKANRLSKPMIPLLAAAVILSAAKDLADQGDSSLRSE